MAREKILALIMAGGAGGRMGPLTQVRAKPAVPYGGLYRLIDFPLSNCMHSGLSDVWIVEQYQPHSLNEHLAGGRPWDLDRTYGGLQLLTPQQGGEQEGWHEGNADAIYHQRAAIRRYAPDTIVVMSADHIYKLDYGEAIARHKETQADVTLVTTTVPIEGAGRFGNVHVDEKGRVTGFQYKPEEPQSEIVTTEVFVYDAAKLLHTLDELVEESDNSEGPALEDFGHQLIPRLVEEGRAYEHRLEGYWMDVGTPQSYWQSHLDLLAPEPRLKLYEPDWPILTYSGLQPPARIYGSARIDNSMISPGCTIRGTVVRSVLSPGVVVEEGATVRDSIILHDTLVESDATVGCAIVDKNVRIGKEARVGGDTGSEITIIGRWTRIPSGAKVTPGAQLPPHATEEHLKQPVE